MGGAEDVGVVVEDGLDVVVVVVVVVEEKAYRRWGEVEHGQSGREGGFSIRGTRPR